MLLLPYNKYVHTEATSQRSHSWYWGTCRIGDMFLCLCQRRLPPVSSATFWHFPLTHNCWSIVVSNSSSDRYTGGSRWEWDQGCKEGGQTTPRWNAPAVFECEQLYAEAYCHAVKISCLLFWMALRKFLGVFAVHVWFYCAPLLYEFHHQHSFPVPEITFYQLSVRRLFKPFWLVCPICVHPLLRMLIGFKTH
jgi:hypothetical protein